MDDDDEDDDVEYLRGSVSLSFHDLLDLAPPNISSIVQQNPKDVALLIKDQDVKRMVSMTGALFGKLSLKVDQAQYKNNHFQKQICDAVCANTALLKALDDKLNVRSTFDPARFQTSPLPCLSPPLTDDERGPRLVGHGPGR